MGSKRKGDNNIHHIEPTSIGGTDDESNLLQRPIYLHGRYHRLFANRAPDEVIHLIKTRWMDENGKLKEDLLRGIKKFKDWMAVFRGAITLEEAVKIINKEWQKN